MAVFPDSILEKILTGLMLLYGPIGRVTHEFAQGRVKARFLFWIADDAIELGMQGNRLLTYSLMLYRICIVLASMRFLPKRRGELSASRYGVDR